MSRNVTAISLMVAKKIPWCEQFRQSLSTMAVILIILLLKMVTDSSEASDENLSMSIYPLGRNMICKENDDLNLTCKITLQEAADITYNLSWILPLKAGYDRVTTHKSAFELTVSIHDLKESDSGRYICEVNGKGILRRRMVKVFVKSEKKECLKQFFKCGNGLCIPSHYACDGNSDCLDGLDESFKYCGADPCKEKVFCERRCIPKRLCCDPFIDANCSVKYVMPCCQKLLYPDLKSSKVPVLQQYSHESFLQCTAFTIATCTILFFCFVVLLVAHTCRCYIRRTALRTPLAFHLSGRHWLWHPSHVDRQMQSVGSRHRTSRAPSESVTNVPRNSNQMSEVEDAALGCTPTENREEDFVLLTFIPGHGFQLADGFAKPPSYTEALLSAHCVEQGPPPPYTTPLEPNYDVLQAERNTVNADE